MEKMAETVSGSHHQRLHHMLSEPAWGRVGVLRQLIADATSHFGYASTLVIDESAFAKKVDLSPGEARQWNRRLGKTDNSQAWRFRRRDARWRVGAGRGRVVSDRGLDRRRSALRGSRRAGRHRFAPRAKWPWR